MRDCKHIIYSTSVVNFMLPPSIHFEKSIPPHAHNFGTSGMPWGGGGGGGLHIFFSLFCLVNYSYTYLDILVNCKYYLNNNKKNA